MGWSSVQATQMALPMFLPWKQRHSSVSAGVNPGWGWTPPPAGQACQGTLSHVALVHACCQPHLTRYHGSPTPSCTYKHVEAKLFSASLRWASKLLTLGGLTGVPARVSVRDQEVLFWKFCSTFKLGSHRPERREGTDNCDPGMFDKRKLTWIERTVFCSPLLHRSVTH